MIYSFYFFTVVYKSNTLLISIIFFSNVIWITDYNDVNIWTYTNYKYSVNVFIFLVSSYHITPSIMSTIYLSSLLIPLKMLGSHFLYYEHLINIYYLYFLFHIIYYLYIYFLFHFKCQIRGRCLWIILISFIISFYIIISHIPY